MKTCVYRLLLFLVLLSSSLVASATHNRAGEIRIVPQFDPCDVNPLAIRAIVSTYSKVEGTDVDRDSLEICWGDGTCTVIPRTNGNGQLLEGNVKKNIYEGTHSYLGPGTYKIGMEDPNRVSNIININDGNSVMVPFYIETEYTVPSVVFQGCNSTPLLTTDPIDIACVGVLFRHNPAAIDEENDSLSYELIVPLQGPGMEVPSYEFPNEVPFENPENQFTINPNSGEIIWRSPQSPGEYNVAFVVKEWRNGLLMSTTIRDMQITVTTCENLPPVVTTEIDEICVIAGELIEFDVVATAPEIEENQQVKLTADGGPLVLSISPATFTPEEEIFQDDPVLKTFRWQTACEHISDQYYQVVFRAVDDFFGNGTGLGTIKTVRIKVVGPPPLDPRAEAQNDMVRISWEQPYTCEDTQTDYFFGFSVWRRDNPNNFTIDTCTPGLEGRGYTKISTGPVLDAEGGRYFFVDENLDRGKTYCYRILGEFALISPGGYPYNKVESLPSVEICQQLKRDIPVITNVSIATTNQQDGTIDVCWSKPIEADLNPALNSGPYVYEVLRATGITTNDADFQPIGVSFTSPTFELANDTCFTDTGLNTTDNAYSYKVNFYIKEDEFFGATAPASSVFLSIAPTDNTNVLTWQESVPWGNYKYTVYRLVDQEYLPIATVTEPNYRDSGLENGIQYCYKIESEGTYSISGIIDPIINLSQETCGIPNDNIPPCAPELEVSNLCAQATGCLTDNQLFNSLTWVNPEDLCAEADDVLGYRVYYGISTDAGFELVEEISDPSDLTIDHFPPQNRGLAGCYVVTAIDSVGNESPFSNTVCTDNCPLYSLPNTFTPNQDGQNDLFVPFAYCFIESVEFQVYNRWGELVFETKDPNLNWDGTNLRGEQLTEGVYYYRCKVFEQRVSVEPVVGQQQLSGYIELIRGK
ncbi:MAG: hypothetical protein DHS20C18_28190 [Saprospiraceae bacterium]|nr:MAG: hypothetical protein DHS20C18_28190 [Saprospiraceae bacterium]